MMHECLEVMEIAKAAGEAIMSHYGRELDIVSKSKKEFDPVTDADLEADRYISGLLEAKFPGMPILSEESRHGSIDYAGKVWVVDPLDGTKEFIRHGKDFSVMIGLVDGGVPLLGVVYAPAAGKMYYAYRGGGAYIKERGRDVRINVSGVSSLDHARQIVRAGYTRKNMLDALVGGLAVGKSLEKSSIGLRLCALAAGDADMYINTNKSNKWDTASGEVILSEAGGVITDFDSKKLDYGKEGSAWERSFIASNMALHGKLMELLPRDALAMMSQRM